MAVLSGCDVSGASKDVEFGSDVACDLADEECTEWLLLERFKDFEVLRDDPGRLEAMRSAMDGEGWKALPLVDLPFLAFLRRSFTFSRTLSLPSFEWELDVDFS